MGRDTDLINSGMTKKEIGFLRGITEGVVAAKKFLVPDSNKDLGVLRYLTAVRFVLRAATAAKGQLSFIKADDATNLLHTLTVGVFAGARSLSIADPTVNASIPFVSSGAGVPGTRGGGLGHFYVDTTNHKLYFCEVAHATAATWTILN